MSSPRLPSPTVPVDGPAVRQRILHQARTHFFAHGYSTLTMADLATELGISKKMRRDRLTFGMMFGIPLMQLMLFGFAINSDPGHLPTAIRMADQGPFARTLLAGAAPERLFHPDARGRHGGRDRPPAPARYGPVRHQHSGEFFAPAAAG